jgi:hypothetical protein
MTTVVPSFRTHNTVVALTSADDECADAEDVDSGATHPIPCCPNTRAYLVHIIMVDARRPVDDIIIASESQMKSMRRARI